MQCPSEACQVDHKFPAEIGFVSSGHAQPREKPEGAGHDETQDEQRGTSDHEGRKNAPLEVNEKPEKCKTYVVGLPEARNEEESNKCRAASPPGPQRSRN
jgi:hypothetical protein